MKKGNWFDSFVTTEDFEQACYDFVKAVAAEDPFPIRTAHRIRPHNIKIDWASSRVVDVNGEFVGCVSIGHVHSGQAVDENRTVDIAKCLEAIMQNSS